MRAVQLLLPLSLLALPLGTGAWAQVGARHAVPLQAHMGPHIRNTPPREASALDRARADSLRTTVRAILERYPTAEAAERDGYRWFQRRVKEPRVYHYTNRQYAMRARTKFDPTRPTSLLFRKDASGVLRPVGVMYTAGPDASVEDLDARVPVALEHWHQHVKLCFPRQEANLEAADMMGPNPRFGPLGKLDTKEACEAAGGRFVPRLFGWMVHVEVEGKAGHVHQP